VVVDAGRAEPLWLAQLDRLLPLVSVPGLDVRLEGNTVRVGGWLAEEDRTSVLNNLMSALGSNYRFGYLREEDIERSQDSRQLMMAALAQVGDEIKPQDLVAILNHWIIAFPEGSAVFPEDARDILNRVAEVLKTARPQSIIEIQGHVDAEGGPGVAQKLSLERANAVRDALMKAGVSSGVLRTKGYGSEKRLATGGAPFDHVRNQRIEFRVIQVCDPYFPCEAAAPAKRVTPPDPNLPAPDWTAPGHQESDPNPSETYAPGKPALRSLEAPNPVSPTADQTRSGSRRAEELEPPEEAANPPQGSKLKALSEELPPPPKPRSKPVEPPKPPAAAKPPEWYDPLGLF
jgi:outer membrane protein OmpA-like peptidoglycan-associated protein